MLPRLPLWILCAFALSACSVFETREPLAEPEIKIVKEIVVKEVPQECPICAALPERPDKANALKSCEPIQAKPKKPTQKKGPVTTTRLPIIGEVEWVSINQKAHRFKARIDTGAATSSIHAEDIKLFERDGRTWAAFNIKPHRSKNSVRIKAPVVRKVSIKQHDRNSDRRHVVELTLMMGNIEMRTEVNLNDRSEFVYPLLIGRSFLEGHAVVDTSQRFMMLD
ncbi:hypothetical protein A3742_14570 [Oleiphilus sp. HI0071]|uniref:ATP-dependent zinc protease family protein n=1 Tax=unclassified Oleiphilus TaxID=2631174 RepID=UPI0007C29D83|nr:MULTISPECIES: RimK/LysX family protein [unclassified Oleiphilus]KZY61717.1 hypothetical protein A3737_05720 [Oleiphilus sp. HI0065]KZY79276.1 hypothetical protein A3742_14570 [Oleiphilus sp. HI0071]KZY92498.1 hypothetical protein A3744_01975 [Oleiphilus sp. HI0073]KZZ43640.1 hypothetical protein A3758_15110 [Oleiphilus sp. HI0118]KZZ49414.1 hypothetical protein A3760_21430 [Oleiphilus sp. HI0122]KZZ68393.1 hypothetical protein A3765_04180 [Oleiphilus sp. HI0130]KZZ73982.1 hypothetical pro